MTGGTSAAAPLWAGVTALFGQYLANKGSSLATLVKSTPGGFNGLLYQSRVAQGSGVFDIVGGDNELGNPAFCAAPICLAVPGYDGVTGLGSPDVARLFASF